MNRFLTIFLTAARASFAFAVGISLLITSVDAAIVQLEQTISPLGTGSFIGQSIALSGDVAIIGGPGIAEIHRFHNEQWVREAVLRPSLFGGYYASDVDISGSLAIVGDWNKRIAYVYRYNGLDWVEEAILDSHRAEGFGASVAIEGNRAVVGAFREDAAYIFEFSAGQWSAARRLYSFDGADFFGASVDISGDTILVGSRGTAHFFEFDGNGWRQIARFVGRGALDDYFGGDVALDGDWAVIGATHDSRVGGWEGAAYVYQRTPTGWMEQARLVADDATERDVFGSAASISGHYVLVGTGGDDGQDPNPQPTAYLYAYADGSWSQIANIPTAGNGVAVALDGARFMTASEIPFGARTVQSYVIVPEPITSLYILSGALGPAAFRHRTKARKGRGR